MSGLRPDLHKTQIALDNLPDGSVVVDVHGNAWQSGHRGIYWYRAYGGGDEPYSSFELAQSAPLHSMPPEAKPLAKPPKKHT